MIILAGHLKTSADLVPDLADTLCTLVEPALKEDGCLNYHFAIDSEAQGTVLVYERWRDQDALSTHLMQPSVTGVLGAWADRIDTTGVRKFDCTNERGFLD